LPALLKLGRYSIRRENRQAKKSGSRKIFLGPPWADRNTGLISGGHRGGPLHPSVLGRGKAASARRGAILALALLSASGCGERSAARIARRILQDHREASHVKPLPPSALIHLNYSSPAGESGEGLIEWDRWRYRETLASAGWRTERGIQGGKGYYTDEDGVTRVASEPVLAELTTHSYFWRRAYLFDDLERARTDLGPSDEGTISVRLTPRGGNPLVLTFSRHGERLLAARSPRFDLVFQSATRLTDASRRESPLQAEIRSIGLPTRAMEDALAGGGTVRWPGRGAEVAFEKAGHGIVFPARIAGLAVRILLDAEADGPVRIRRNRAAATALAFRPDMLGREVARGGPLEIGAASFSSLLFQRVDSIPEGADAAAGAALFREAIVEVDPGARRLALLDPAKWVSPAGYFRGLLDDDGDRPVAILRTGRQTLRVLAGVPSRAALLLAPEAAARSGLASPGALASDLRWGAADLPSLTLSVESGRFDPDWGEDGRLGFDALLAFHVFFDMPHRWTYLKPLSGGSTPTAHR